ncbi:MAG: aspartate-semialdehyde dehydrogenase [Christensenellales bacterium]
MQRFRVGVIGATGMVGQRLVGLLAAHPWFHITALAASAASAGKPYWEAVAGRWAMDFPLPAGAAEFPLLDAGDVGTIAGRVDFVFCAVSLPKAETRALEEAYARAEVPVISNNAACRMLDDIPMIIPEINADHLRVIAAQRERLGCRRGFIAVKPNCSIQSYVPALTPLMGFGLEAISVCTYQAVSGAGRTLASWPEIEDNVIPYIAGEEEKSEQEPLKIWGRLSGDGARILPAGAPLISAQCLRVPVQDGHLAAVSVSFERKPEREEILAAWRDWKTLPQQLALPSAPLPFLTYFEAADRPQTRLDRDIAGGMGVALGRLRQDRLFDWRFVCLSHNTLRGAAGGSVLTAELLCRQGYIIPEVGA